MGMKTILMLLVLVLPLTACLTVKTDPISVEPIEITMNVNLRVVRELDDFFGDLDAASPLMQVPAVATPIP
jgi:hypothetical protein